MMMGPKNPHTLLNKTDCLDSRITAMKSYKGESIAKESLGKTGKRPRENESVRGLFHLPQRKKFMQVGKAGSFPAQRSWLNLRVRKCPWTCSINMYPSAPPIQDPRPQGWPSGMGKCPRNCLPVQYPHPPPQSQVKGICLWFPTSPQRRGS